MEMFKTNKWSSLIEAKDVTKVTGKSLYYIDNRGKEQRELLNTNSYDWHLTKTIAINYLIDRYTKNIKSCEKQILECQQKINNLKSF